MSNKLRDRELLGIFFWFVVLSRLNLSVAYPLQSISYIGAIYLLSLLNLDMILNYRRLFGHRHGILISFLTIFSFLAFIVYLIKEKPRKKNKILIFMTIILALTVISSNILKHYHTKKMYAHKISYKMMHELYDFLKKEEVRLGRKPKIISLNSRNIVLYSRVLGYFFESRREDWLNYLIYKMDNLNIDYFIINKHYSYYEYSEDKKQDYFSVMRYKTPKRFRLLKSFKEIKTDNWIGVYQRTD